MRRYAIITTILICSCYNSTVFDLYETIYPSGSWPTGRDGPWEHFETDAIDLEGYSLVFTPQRGETVSYSWDAEGGLTDFPLTPGSGASSTTLSLSDDDYSSYSFERLDTLRFYGEPYEQMFVSSNGYITFGAGSQSLSNDVDEHFLLPAVSVLRHDLDPRDIGRVVVDEWATLVAITYEGVPAYGETSPNHVQIVLHTNGTIELNFVGVTGRTSWIVGLSNGLSGPRPDEVNFVGGSTTREQCWDGIDNDGDGLVDCDDGDCVDECGAEREYDCFNGRDDDHDGLVDCDDPDCAYEMECYGERDCGDRLDNDGDGLADCDDPDCWDQPVCEILCQGYWESFEPGEIEDLEGTRLQFRPSPSEPQGYSLNVRDRISDFNVDPHSGDVTEVFNLGDDDSREFVFQVFEGFTFFDRTYDSVFVSSNGYVTFGRGSPSLGYAPWSHFELPSIAALRGDLNPRSGGEVVVDETSRYVAVTFLDVPWFSDPSLNTFQIELRRNGNISIVYLDVPEGREGYTAGLSNGCGTENYPPEIDFVSNLQEDCTDGVDNDGDGRIDCSDSDCEGDPECRDLSRGFWEAFTSTDTVDIEGYLLTYIRDDSSLNGYSWSIEWQGHQFAEMPGMGEIFGLFDIRGDDYVEYPLSICGELRFFDDLYDRIFVSSNGYITFGEGSTSQSVEPELHFHLPSVAGFRADLDPLDAGSVMVDEYSDHVTVTYDTVPFWDNPMTLNSFQISIYVYGTIVVHYAVFEGEGNAIVGLSDGSRASVPPETNFIP